MSVRGHDGMTWQERRLARKREGALRSSFFMECEVHGEVPIHPYSDGCLFCVEAESEESSQPSRTIPPQVEAEGGSQSWDSHDYDSAGDDA